MRNKLISGVIVAGVGLAAPALGYAAPTNLVTNGTFANTSYATAYQLPNAAWGPSSSGWKSGPSQPEGPANPNGWAPSGLAGWVITGGPSGFPTGNTTTDPTNPLFAWYPTVAAATSASPVNEYGDPKQYFNAQGALASSTVPGGGGILYMDADPTYRGVLYQTLTGLTAGDAYVVSFDWAAGQLLNRDADTTENLSVSLGADALGAAGFGSQTHDTTPTQNLGPQAVTNWMDASYTFIASGATQVLSFLPDGTPGGEPPSVLLTDVAVYQAPEPGTLAILGTAVIGLVGAGVRRRRQSRRG